MLVSLTVAHVLITVAVGERDRLTLWHAASWWALHGRPDSQTQLVQRNLNDTSDEEALLGCYKAYTMVSSACKWERSASATQPHTITYVREVMTDTQDAYLTLHRSPASLW